MQNKDKISSGRCLVIGAGDLTIGEIKREKEDLVLAVDGGFSYCGILGLEPDYLIGDFDSVSQEERQAIHTLKEQIPDRIIELYPEKDDTDMLASLRLGLGLGYRTFYIYGGTGGRLEHTLANIQCLLYLKEQEAVGYIMDGDGMIFVMKDESVQFQKSMRGMLSLFSLGREAKGVTIKGLKYPLEDYTLSNSFPIGISNEFIGEEGTVSVRDGELVCLLRYMD